MTVTMQKATEIFGRLTEQDQTFALDFLARLERHNDLEKQLRNAEYLNRVQRAIDQIAQGKGTVREIIEVYDD